MSRTRLGISFLIVVYRSPPSSHCLVREQGSGDFAVEHSHTKAISFHVAFEKRISAFVMCFVNLNEATDQFAWKFNESDV
jgi:hypothetical protein